MPVKISTIFRQGPFSNIARVEKFLLVRIQKFEENYERKKYAKEVNAI